MGYKRILTIQDISCVGQCSMTVALPILSACGHETCILPTALLSTHTGGFGKPTVVHFDDALEGIWRHWQEQGITFDAILVGYLGSIPAVKTAARIIGEMLAPDGVAVVDPAMADHGKLYSGLTLEYAQAMAGLCRKAHIVLPNLTEAAMLAGMAYPENRDDVDLKSLMKAMNLERVVLTGVSHNPEQTGAAVWEGKQLRFCSHPRMEQSYHGTGDMFAAAFTGALLQGKNLVEAAEIAGRFTLRAIENTQNQPAHWYGVKFETALPYLTELLS